MINKQQNGSECGVVALYNALNLVGYGMKYQEVKDYLYYFDVYNPPDGMLFCDLKNILKQLPFNFKYFKTKNYETVKKTIDKSLKFGYSIIMEYVWFKNVKVSYKERFKKYDWFNNKKKHKSIKVSHAFTAVKEKNKIRVYNFDNGGTKYITYDMLLGIIKGCINIYGDYEIIIFKRGLNVKK